MHCQIFKNVAEPGKQEIVLKNFMKFFSADRATQAFSRFEVTVNGTITKQALFKWVLDVYKERKSLSLTLNDNRSVIYQVNLLLDGVGELSPLENCLLAESLGLLIEKF